MPSSKQLIEPSFLPDLRDGLEGGSKFIQVILGPRQVGKTTGVLEFLEKYRRPSLYFSADEVIAPDEAWLLEKWQQALAEDDECLLVIDEIQKIPDWSRVIKRLWDQQAKKKSALGLILLGSSSLQITSGLEESLSGRFQLIRARHWNFSKSIELADLNVETFIRQGGYPGSYSLLGKSKAWKGYIRDSIVETVIGKDILSIARIKKPALFRQSYSLLMSYPAQEISYNKLLGQLQESGNVDLVKHYIELFESAFLLKALFKYSPKPLVKRASSPKILPLCGALIDRSVLKTRDGYGRAFEAAVGAALIGDDYEVSYWRDGSYEVDFVIEHEGTVVAIEVKSGLKKNSKGLSEFIKLHPGAEPVYVTGETIESFLKNPRRFVSRLVENK